ncbi:helix-turn-helix domain-containing protein [Luteimicrobium subarcticum]|uniref:helix-turn-helix domain-containing protein n=1 Tax=Luteimicrobium subarcticum TaxID=620910 RepID=UPI001FE658C3|nr:helix-turn-helix domain-containing protein [Luteimicrobium subarcticum]
MTERILNARSLPLLGQAIRGLRTARGLTQAQLAARAGVSRQWVVAVERGETRGLEVGLVMRVLDEIGASLVVRDDVGDAGDR